jgi:hypothetical protein
LATFLFVMSHTSRVFLLLGCCVCSFAWADGPADNLVDKVRPIPPAGIEIPPERAAALTSAARALEAEVQRAIAEGKLTAARAPDVLIFSKAVAWAIHDSMVFDVKELDHADVLLDAGRTRLSRLIHNDTAWERAPGLVVRGYRSTIDDSIQPYGLVIPKEAPRRLDVWFHGRGEKLSELSFLHQRRHQVGEFAPAGTVVLHPYGRYCNGSRFAGETDFWEALAHAQQALGAATWPVLVRGFSLGGAACWHLATHHPHRWLAANPGAGFSETEQFLNFFQSETLQPAPWERRLWHLYDATSSAANLTNTRTLAYSGAIDRQKQAADLMAAAMKAEGLVLQHVVAPDTAHKISDEAKVTIAAQLDAWTAAPPPLPESKKFVAYTLKYPTAGWVTLHGLAEHWKEARIAQVMGQAPGTFITANITSLDLAPPATSLDGQPITPGSWHRVGARWIAGNPALPSLAKRQHLQGPIDDAFMRRFIFVMPTGTAKNPHVAAWARGEADRAVREWRRHFRGDVRVVDDRALSEADLKSSNLILWGDPTANAVMARLLPQTPLGWTDREIRLGTRAFPASDHALVAIYPNPEAPENYVVCNSGFTFREYDYLNNARQTPKLPDWAVLDLKTVPNARFPGKIVAADFFDEAWHLKPADGS